MWNESDSTDPADPQEAMMARLNARNATNAPSLVLARMNEELLTEVNALDKENHERSKDLAIAGTEIGKLQAEKAAAAAAEAEAKEAARQMGEKLAEAQAKSADLKHSLQQATAREAALKKENETLLAKYMEALQLQAAAMDGEIEQFEKAKAESPRPDASAAPAASAPSPALAPLERFVGSPAPGGKPTAID